MSSTSSEIQRALYEVWSREFRARANMDRVPVQCVSRMSRRLHTAMSEEMQRITRVVAIVPTYVDIIIDSRACLRALQRVGIFTGSE